MNKEQIIEALKAAAEPYMQYYIEDEVRQAMTSLTEPFDLVAPILEIIGTNPNVDFGAPGDLVHYVECFSNKGYEELLIESVRKTPTPHNIWMLHRCFNNPNDNRRGIYKAVIEELLCSDVVSDDVKREINSFPW